MCLYYIQDSAIALVHAYSGDQQVTVYSILPKHKHQRQYKTHFDYIYKMLHIIFFCLQCSLFMGTVHSAATTKSLIYSLFGSINVNIVVHGRNSAFHAGDLMMKNERGKEKKNARKLYI